MTSDCTMLWVGSQSDLLWNAFQTAGRTPNCQLSFQTPCSPVPAMGSKIHSTCGRRCFRGFHQALWRHLRTSSYRCHSLQWNVQLSQKFMPLVQSTYSSKTNFDSCRSHLIDNFLFNIYISCWWSMSNLVTFKKPEVYIYIQMKIANNYFTCISF